MNKQALLLSCSLALNLALLITLGAALRSSPPKIETVSPGLESTHSSTPPLSAVAEPDHGIADVLRAFRTIRSGQYRDGLAELRKMGIPESVVQDASIGAISRRYARSLLALRRTPSRYWEPVQRHKLDESDVKLQNERHARALEAERDKMVRDILGLEWASVVAQIRGRPDPLDELTESFDPRWRARAREVLGRYDALERDVIRTANGTLGIPDRAELNQLYQSKLQELNEFLSPQEIEEYQLRTSPTAEHLKQIDLVGFAPTEQEFRIIHRLRKDFDDRQEHSRADGIDWQAQASLEDSLRQALGEKRYADYRRSQDYTFRGLVELADQFDLPNEAAVQVHAIRESVLQQARALREDPSLRPEERSERLQQIRRASEEAVQRLLGETAYRKYTQLDISSWIENIYQQ